jgi:hypothetical protein
MPNGSAQTVATIEIRSDSSIAVHSAGERPSTMASYLFGRFSVSVRVK